MLEEFLQALADVGLAIINAIPLLLYVLVTLLIGYVVAVAARAGVKALINKVLWRFLERTTIGQKLKESGVDLGSILGTFVFVFIMALAFMVAINALNIPGGEFIVEFIRLIVGVLGGLIVLSIGLPLAALGAEYLAKLIVLPLRDKHEAFQSMVSIALSVILVLFVFGLALAVMFGTPALLQTLTGALPAGTMAGVIIIVGYMIADVVGNFVKELVAQMTRPIESTDVVRALKVAGIELSTFISGVVKATIVVLAVSVALGMIGAAGIASDILGSVATYLPKILGALVLLTLGLALVIVLGRYIGRVFRSVTKERYEPLAELVENLVSLGLIAAFVAIALNILGLLGELVYSLIIGSIVIAIGVIVVESLTKLLVQVHPTYEKLAPLIGTVIALVFAYVGVSAILLQIPGASQVLSTVGWGIGIAFAVMLVPLVFYFIRVAWREAEASR